MTPYEQELHNIPRTLDRARSADVNGLKNAIAGASEASIIAVGSGGSFTVASLLCSLHEAYTGRVSRAVTPLELICNPTLASTSPIFVISAEGKNPDVIEALKRARRHSSRTVHVVTNRSDSPLMECVRQLHDVTPHVFELTDKDGYLATNSLVLDATLTARVFEELDGQVPNPLDVSTLSVSGSPLQEWLVSGQDFVQSAVRRRGLIVVYSPHLRPIAEDLESKLSESALLTCQLADFRSFAHGRHLWLTERSQDTALMVLTEPETENLWKDMEPLIPTEVPRFVMSLSGATPNDLLGGLIASMHLISELANCAERNIAKPQVSALGRQLYYADLSVLIPPPIEPGMRGEHSKYEVLGAHWPSPRKSGKLRRALEATELAFSKQRFRSIVFDYDGTLCSSNSLDVPPTKIILDHIARLTNEGIIVGIASGRGGSIAEHLERYLDPSHWPNIRLGLYNGGWIGRMGEKPGDGEASDFLVHANRIISALQSCGVPISTIRQSPPYQLSIRCQVGVNTENMWFVVADAMRQSGMEAATVLRSKHSVDILSKGVSKSRLVARIVQENKIDPYEIVTMGDLGAWPGNDSSLLQHQFSLSVDLPSRRLDRGWKLAPQHKRDIDATIWYLERIDFCGDGTFRFELERQ